MPPLDRTIRIYALPRMPALAGARHRDSVLDALDAPEAGGIVETADRHLARQAVAEHNKVALVDPLDYEGVILLWRMMERERDGVRFGPYVGPWLYFDPAAYRAPVLQKGGLSARDAVALYLAGSPVPLALPVGRLSVRRYSEPPSPLWRRTVPAPAHLNCQRAPTHFEAWQRFEVRLRAVPAPAQLADWYRRVRASVFIRFAVHKFLQDLADGITAAYLPLGDSVPGSFFGSDVDLDIDRGNLYGRHDARLPLARLLRFHAAGDLPAIRTASAAELIAAYRDELLRLHRRHPQIDFVRRMLPTLSFDKAYAAIRAILPPAADKTASVAARARTRKPAGVEGAAIR